MELYYLTVIDGNIMDLFTFYRSSKTHTQAYLQFLEQHRIISKADDVESGVAASQLAALMSNKSSASSLLMDIDKKTSISSGNDVSSRLSSSSMDVSSINDVSMSSQVVQLKTGEIIET